MESIEVGGRLKIWYGDIRSDPEGILRFRPRTPHQHQAAPSQIQSAIEIWCFCVWWDNNIRSGRAGRRVSRKLYQITIYKVLKSYRNAAFSKCF